MVDCGFLFAIGMTKARDDDIDTSSECCDYNDSGYDSDSDSCYDGN